MAVLYFQRRCRRATRLGQVMPAGAQHVTVENLHPVIRQQWLLGTQIADECTVLAGHVTHQRAAGAWLQSLEFVIHCLHRDADLLCRRLVCQVDARLVAKYRLAHQIEHGGEHQLAGVPRLADLTEPAIQELGFQTVFQARPSHRDDWAEFGEAVQQQGQSW